MLRKIIIIDAILIAIFFLVNYLSIILRIDYILSIYFIFVIFGKVGIVFPFAISSLIVIPLIKQCKLFYGVLNLLVVYLLFWLTFLWIVSIGIDKYGV